MQTVDIEVCRLTRVTRALILERYVAVETFTCHFPMFEHKFNSPPLYWDAIQKQKYLTDA